MFSSLSSWLSGQEKDKHGHPNQPQKQQQYPQQPLQQQQQQQQRPQIIKQGSSSHLESVLMNPNKEGLGSGNSNGQQLQQQQQQQQRPKATGNAGLTPHQQDQGTSLTGQKYLPSSPYLLPYDQALPASQQQQARQYQQQQQQLQQQQQQPRSPMPAILSLPKQDPLSTIQSKKDFWQLYYMDDKAVHQYLNGISSATDISPDIEMLLYSARQNVSTDVDEALTTCYPSLLHNDTPSAQLSLTDLSTALARALIVMGGDVGLLNAMAEVCKKRAMQIDMISKSQQGQNHTHFGNANPNPITDGTLDSPFVNETPLSPPRQIIPSSPSLLPLLKNEALQPSLQSLPPLDTPVIQQNSSQQQSASSSSAALSPTLVTFQYPSQPQLLQQQTTSHLCAKCHVNTLSTVYRPNRLLNPIQHFCAHTTVFLPSLGDNQGIYEGLKRSITLPRPLIKHPHGLTILSPLSSYIQTNLFILNEYMHKYRLIVSTPSLNQEAYHYMLDSKIALFYHYLIHRPAQLTSTSSSLSLTHQPVQFPSGLASVPVEDGDILAAPKIQMIDAKHSKNNKNKNNNDQTTRSRHNSTAEIVELPGIQQNNSSSSSSSTNIHHLPHGGSNSSISYLTTDMNILYNITETPIHRSYTSVTDSQQEVHLDLIDHSLLKVLQREDLDHEQSSLYSLCEGSVFVPLQSPEQSFLSLAIHRTRPQYGFKTKPIPVPSNNNNKKKQQKVENDDQGVPATIIEADETDESPNPDSATTRLQLKPSNTQQNSDGVDIENKTKNLIPLSTVPPLPSPGELGYYTHCQLNSTVDTRPFLRQGSFVALSLLHHHVHSKLRLSEDNLFLYWLVDTSTASVELRKPASSPLPSPIVKEFVVPMIDSNTNQLTSLESIDLSDPHNPVGDLNNVFVDTKSPRYSDEMVGISAILNERPKRHVIHRPSFSASGVDLHHAWRYSTNTRDEFLPESTFKLSSTVTSDQPPAHITTDQIKYSISTHDTIESLNTLNNLISGRFDSFSLSQLDQQALLPHQQLSSHSSIADSTSATNLLKSNSGLSNSQTSIFHQQVPVRPSSLSLQGAPESSLLQQSSHRSLLEQVQDEVEQSLRRSNSHHSTTSQLNASGHHHSNNNNNNNNNIPQHPIITSCTNTNIPQPIYDLSTSQIPSKPITHALNLANPTVHRLYATYYDVRVAAVEDVMLFVHTHVPSAPLINIDAATGIPPTRSASSSVSSKAASTNVDGSIQGKEDNNNNNNNNNNETGSSSSSSVRVRERTGSSSSTASTALTRNLPPHLQPIDLSLNLALYSHLQQSKTRNTHIGTRVQAYPSSLPLSTRGIPVEAIVGLEEFTTIQHPYKHYSDCLYGNTITQTSFDNATSTTTTTTTTQPKSPHEIHFDEATCTPLSQANQYDRLYQNQGCSLHNTAVSTLEEEINRGNTNPDHITAAIPTPSNYHACSSTTSNSLTHPHSSKLASTVLQHNQNAKPCQCASSHIYGLRIIYEVPQRVPSQAATPQEYWAHITRLDSENRKLFQHECDVNGWDYNSTHIPFPYLRVYRKQLTVQFVDKNEQTIWSRSIIELKNQFFKTTENEVEQIKKLVISNMIVYLKMQDFALKNVTKSSRYNTPLNSTLSPILSQANLFSTLPTQLQSQLVDPLSITVDPQTGLNLKKRFGMDMDIVIPTLNQSPAPSITTTTTPIPQSSNGSTSSPSQSTGFNTNSPINTTTTNTATPPTLTPSTTSSPNSTTANTTPIQSSPQLSNGPQNAMVLRPFTKIHFRLPLVSRIVTPATLQLLMSQMGRRASLVKWHLGYSLILDGADISHLWRSLKGYNHTLFIIRTNDGDILGGYSGQQWKPEGGYHGNYESFVYRLHQGATYVDPFHGTKMVNYEQLPPNVQHIASAVEFNVLNQPFTSPSLPDDESTNGLQSSASSLGASMSSLQSSMSTLSGLNITAPVELTSQQQRYINDVDLLPLTTFTNGVPEIFPWKGPLNYFVFTNRDAFGFGGGGGTALHIWNNLGQGKSEVSGSFQNPQLSKNKEWRIYEFECWVGK